MTSTAPSKDQQKLIMYLRREPPPRSHQDRPWDKMVGDAWFPVATFKRLAAEWKVVVDSSQNIHSVLKLVTDYETSLLRHLSA